MPLQESRKYLQFNDGSMESTDPDVNPATIAEITNGGFDHDLSISKRKGFQRIGTNARPAAAVGAETLAGNGNALALRALGGVLGVTDVQGVDPLSSPRMQADYPIDRATVFTHANPVNANTSSCAVLGGYLCIATAFTGINVEVVIVELVTGAVVLRSDFAPGTFGHTGAVDAPCVVVIGAKFWVYARATASHTIWYYSIDPSTLATAAGTVFTTDATQVKYAAVADVSGVLFAFTSTNGGLHQLEVAHATDGFTLSSLLIDAGITDADDVALLRSVEPADIGKVFIAYSQTGGGVSYARYTGTLSARDLGPTVWLNNAKSYSPVGIAYPAGTTDLYLVAVDSSASRTALSSQAGLAPASFAAAPTPTLYPYVNVLTQPWGMAAGKDATGFAAGQPARAFVVGGQAIGDDDGFSSTAPTLCIAHVFMLGQAGGGGNELNYGHGAFVPPNLFSSASAPVPVSVAIGDGSGAGFPNAPLPVPAIAGTSIYVPLRRLASFDAKATPNASGLNYAMEVVRFTPRLPTVAATAAPRVVASGSVYVAGGLLAMYDGNAWSEDAPVWPPVTVTPWTDGGGAHPAAGKYSYKAHWVWDDANGLAHRGPTSDALSYTTVTGGVQVKFAGVLPSRALAVSNPNFNRFRIEIYRTKLLGSVYYLLATKALTPGTNITYTDATDDSVLGTNRQIYATNVPGDVLQSEPSPALATIALHQDRLWGIPQEDPHSLRFTQVKLEGFGYEWNASLSLRLDQGTPIALASMDDKLLILTDKDTWAVVGQGPTATGANLFQPAEMVARGLGASGRNSVVVTPLGAIVHSTSGFKLLGRDLSVADMGVLLDTAPGSATIQASRNFSTRQEAWFVLAGGVNVVVFEYERGRMRWHLLTLGAGTKILDLEEQHGRPVFLTLDPADNGGAHDVLQLSDSAFDDYGSYVPFAVQTGWYRPEGDGLADSRFRVLHVYATVKGGSTSGLTVDVEVQGEQRNIGTKETYVFTAAALAKTVPGHVRIRLKRQRGYAARVTLTETTAGGTPHPGITLHGIEWETGIRGKSTKVTAAAGPG